MNPTLEGTIEESAVTGLVTLPKLDVLTTFTTPGALLALLAPAVAQVREVKPDLTTAKGRKAVGSRAYKVAQTKTYLDGIGKELVADMKKQPGIVDANRKAMRDFLDSLSAEIRKPLTDWEEDEAAEAAIRQAEEEAAALLLVIEADHELALLLNDKHDRDADDRRKAAVQAALDRDELLRKEGEARAAKAVQDQIDTDKREADRKELEAKQAIEQAEADTLAANKRAKDAEDSAKKTAEDAVEAERLRVETAAQVERDAAAARERDVEHRRTFNQEAVADVLSAMNGTPMGDSMAESVVRSIAQGKVRHTTIAY